jgi:hypothetical protein
MKKTATPKTPKTPAKPTSPGKQKYAAKPTAKPMKK